MRILPLMAVILAGGGALHASYGPSAPVSPNLHIVEKNQDHHQKPQNGFMGLLKRSARDLGKGMVQAFSLAGRAPKGYAKNPVRKPMHGASVASPGQKVSGGAAAKTGEPSLDRVVMPGLTILLSQNPRAGGGLSGIKKSDILPDCGRARQSLDKAGEICPFFAFELPSLRRFIDWFRPVAQSRSRISDTSGGIHILAGARQGDLIQGQGLFSQPPRAGEGRALASPKHHFTIDRAPRETLLTHGAVGARSALPCDRPRNNRA